MTRRGGKTAALLDHYRSRPNEDVPVSEAAAACDLDPKVASTLAARLVRNGRLVRVSRGVYSYETGPPDEETSGAVVEELLSLVAKAFGTPVAERLEARLRDPRGEDPLSTVFGEVCCLIGTPGGERLLRGVLRGLPDSEARAVLKSLGVAQ